MTAVGGFMALAAAPASPAEAPTGAALALIGVLVVLLVEQEVLRAARDRSAAPLSRALSIAITPLLVAFAVVVAVQLATILR